MSQAWFSAAHGVARDTGEFLLAALRNSGSKGGRGGTSVTCFVISRSEITSSTTETLISRRRKAQPRESALKQKLLIERGIPSVNCAMECIAAGANSGAPEYPATPRRC